MFIAILIGGHLSNNSTKFECNRPKGMRNCRLEKIFYFRSGGHFVYPSETVLAI